MISNKWKEKSTIERSAYVEKQNEDKIRFAKEVEVFVAKHPEFAEKYEKKKRKKGSPTGNGNPNKKSKSGNNGSSSSSESLSDESVSTPPLPSALPSDPPSATSAATCQAP